MAKVITSDYAQMLLNGVDNFTATYFAEVIGTVSHDTIGRSIADIKLSPKIVREKALELIVPSSNGYLALDDSVMDKGSSEDLLQNNPVISYATSWVRQPSGCLLLVKQKEE